LTDVALINWNKHVHIDCGSVKGFKNKSEEIRKTRIGFFVDDPAKPHGLIGSRRL